MLLSASQWCFKDNIRFVAAFVCIRNSSTHQLRQELLRVLLLHVAIRAVIAIVTKEITSKQQDFV